MRNFAYCNQWDAITLLFLYKSNNAWILYITLIITIL